MARGHKSFDRVADCYDATRALPPDALAAVAAGIVRTLHEVTPAPKLLEVGIGTGRIAVPLATLGVGVVGIDIAPAMLARLRAKRPAIPVAIAEATELPFPADTFDGVLFVHLLHLLPDAGAALRAAHAALRPGRVLLFGRTDHTESPRRQVIAQARELARDFAGVALGSGDWHAATDRAFAAHAQAAGAPVARVTLARWVERTTGRDMLNALARGTYSSTWAIPEGVMPELLQRLTPRIDGLLGGLDRAIETEATFTLVSARLPG